MVSPARRATAIVAALGRLLPPVCPVSSDLTAQRSLNRQWEGG